MQRLLSKISLRFVIMLFCLPFLILLLVTCTLFYHMGSERFSNLLTENTITLVEQTQTSINNKLEEIYHLSSPLLSSHIFYKLRTNISNNKVPLVPQDYLNFAKQMESFIIQNSSTISSISLYLSDKSIFFYRSLAHDMPVQLDFNFDVYYDSFAPYQLNWIYLDENYPYHSNYGTLPNFSLMELIGTPNTALQGFFLIGLNDKVFIDEVKNCRLTENSCVTIVQNGDLLYTDSKIFNNSTLSTLSNEDLDLIHQITTQAEDTKLLSLKLSNTSALYMPLSLPNSGLLAIIPSDEMFVDYSSFRHSILVLGLFILLCCIVLYLLISWMLSYPVISLVKQMEQVTSNTLTHPIHVEGSKEILHISQGINSLLEKISKLMESLQEEMHTKQRTQLQALHSQINPHFMYNALDAIKQLCEMNETKKVSQMVDHLAIFYRIGVSKGRDIVTLKEEITHMSMYLNILHTRFEDFEYVVSVPPKLFDCTIVKITLQPIVENALYHGLRPYRTDGCIWIKSFTRNACLYLQVEDNGAGIQEDILEELQLCLASPIGNFNSSCVKIYGIKNVHDRIRLTYGDDYGLSIKSIPDEGTIVTIKIPFITEEK